MITLKGEYEEDYVLEVLDMDERVCYMNHGNEPNWMWMYDVLILKFGVRILFNDFKFMILEQTLVATSQLHPNSWAMIRGFEIIYEYVGVSPSIKVYFYLFTLTCPNGDEQP